MTTGRIKNDITRLDYIELLSESINHLPQPHLYSPWWPSDWPSWPGHWRSSWMMTPGWVSPPDPDPPPRSLRPPASHPPASFSGLRCCRVCPASCNKASSTLGLNINNVHWKFLLNWHVKNCLLTCLTLLWGSLFVIHPRWPQAACPPRRSHWRCTENISRQRSRHST